MCLAWWCGDFPSVLLFSFETMSGHPSGLQVFTQESTQHDTFYLCEAAALSILQNCVCGRESELCAIAFPLPPLLFMRIFLLKASKFLSPSYFRFLRFLISGHPCALQVFLMHVTCFVTMMFTSHFIHTR